VAFSIGERCLFSSGGHLWVKSQAVPLPYPTHDDYAASISSPIQRKHMRANSTDQFRAYERILVLLDQFPFGAVYRIALGFLLVPLASTFPISVHPGLSLASWFLGVLLALRLVPVVFRRILPFSERVTAVWAARRQTAKRFDSYQWRKLVWFGVGLSAHAVSSRQFSGPSAILAVFCVVGGALGVLAWRQGL
jgi:hypothetical protein